MALANIFFRRLDERIGEKFLKAGPGYGGSCFPKDTLALNRIAQDHGVSSKIVQAVIEVNSNQKARMYCQKNIMEMICIMKDSSSEIENMIDEEIESVREAGLMSDQDYNEYNYNRDVDSQADEADALNSVFGGEE